MTNSSKYVALVYLAISSITVLVMLTTSFELLKEQYLPSFLLAQKYALPILLSAMMITFFTFFEPERLHQKESIRLFQAVMTVTCIIFTYYLSTIDSKVTSVGTLIVYIIQWFAIVGETVRSFMFKNTEAAK